MNANNFHQLNKPKETKQDFFTGEHLATIVKYLVSLAIVFLILSAGKWSIEYVTSHQPVPPTQHQVDSSVAKIIKTDFTIFRFLKTLPEKNMQFNFLFKK